MATNRTDNPQSKQVEQQRQQQPEQGERSLSRRQSIGGSLAPLSIGPFGWMRRMFEDMEQLMGLSPRLGRGDNGMSMFMPQVDVTQEKDRILVHADLPGLSPDDVKLQIVDGALIIEGERKSEREQDVGGVMRTERYFGQFQRVVPLPDGADPDSAEARFENGVLEVSIAAPQRSAGRQIEIRSGGARKGGTQH